MGTTEPVRGAAKLCSHGFPSHPQAGAGAVDGARAADLSCPRILPPWGGRVGREVPDPPQGSDKAFHRSVTPGPTVDLPSSPAPTGPGQDNGLPVPLTAAWTWKAPSALLSWVPHPFALGVGGGEGEG